MLSSQFTWADIPRVASSPFEGYRPRPPQPSTNVQMVKGTHKGKGVWVRMVSSGYLRLIASCITQLKAQGPSRTCDESKEEETKKFRVVAGAPCGEPAPNVRFCFRVQGCSSQAYFEVRGTPRGLPASSLGMQPCVSSHTGHPTRGCIPRPARVCIPRSFT